MEFTSTSFTASAIVAGMERIMGFETIDGYFISCEEGEAALRSGCALLVGGLLVGVFTY